MNAVCGENMRVLRRIKLVCAWDLQEGSGGREGLAVSTELTNVPEKCLHAEARWCRGETAGWGGAVVVVGSLRVRCSLHCLISGAKKY